MLIAARGNPRLLALSDSPVKLVASVIRAWWGEGWRGREGYTTLLNNCGASQIENSKVSPEGIGILLYCKHGQKEEEILPCCKP